MSGVESVLKGNGIKYYQLLVFAFLLILGLGIYSNTFKVPFHLDDTAQIQLSQDTKSLEVYQKFITWVDFTSFRPLSKLSLALNYRIHQDELPGYHIVNLLIHILASFIVFLFIREILKSPVVKFEKLRKYSNLFAFSVALLYLAHPIQTQAVTYIVQRMTSMAGMFYLLSCLFYLKARYAWIGSKKHYLLYFAVAVVSGFLAILSKQNAVTFPAAWLLLEFFFVRSPENRMYKKYLGGGAVLLSLLVLTVILLGKLPRETQDISRFDYLLTQFRVIPKYIQLSLVPVGQNIDHDVVVSSGVGVKEVAGFLLILALFLVGISAYKKHPLISFGIFWFFLNLAITSSIIPISDVIFEHRLYLSLPGLLLAVCYVLFRFLFASKVRNYAILVLIIFFVFGGLSYARNAVWKSGYTLWSDAYEKSPDKLRVQQNLGLSYIHQADYRKALGMFDKVIAQKPDHYNARFNRANIRLRFQDYRGAIDDLEVFIEKYPKTLQAWQGLGQAHMELGEPDQAEEAYNRMIELDEDNALAYYERGRLWMLKKQYQAALRDFLKARELNPTNAAIYNMIGQIYTYLGQKDQAVEYFGQAIEIAPDYARAYFNRGYIFAGEHKIDAALDDLNKAIKYDARIYEAYKARGLVLYWKQEYEKAYQDLMTATQAGIAVPPDLIQEISNNLNNR